MGEHIWTVIQIWTRGQAQPQDVKSICNKFPQEMGNLLKGTKHQLVKKSILNFQGRINPAHSVGDDM